MNPLKASLDILKKRKKTYYVIITISFLLVFSQAFFSGQYLYKTDKEAAENFIELVANSTKIRIIANIFKERNYILAGTLIFLNNFSINALSMYLGMIPLFPLFILFSNALMTGFIFGIESLMPPTPTIYNIIVFMLVAIMEFSSFILVTYEGLRIGFALINPKIFNQTKRKNALKQNLKEGTNVLVIVLLLLMIGAIIETMGIVLFSSRFIS
jgi:uncharacterized membrane protein SpoIIM required for sporulation